MTRRSLTIWVQTQKSIGYQMQYHVFISHASEDKDVFVRPLAERLRQLGVRVWYDEFTMHLGDSLRESIDHGLTESRYGLVILSQSFFKKHWTKRELNGLVARQIHEDRTVILPIWYNIGHSEILAESPPLADILGLKYEGDLEVLARTIVNKLKMNEPYVQLGGLQHASLLNRDGSRAIWHIERKVRVNEQPLTCMEIRISSEGKLSLKNVTPGRSVGFHNISGTRTIRIEYDEPILPGVEFTQVVVFDAIDMFIDEENALTVVPKIHYETFSLSVEQSEENSILDVRAQKLLGVDEINLSGLQASADGKSFSVELKDLEIGQHYRLIWKKVDL